MAANQAELDVEWMFADAATGTFGFNALASLNPMRWSESLDFTSALKQMQDLQEHQQGDRPVIVKIPSGITTPEHKCANVEQAIAYIKSKSPAHIKEQLDKLDAEDKKRKLLEQVEDKKKALEEVEAILTGEESQEKEAHKKLKDKMTELGQKAAPHCQWMYGDAGSAWSAVGLGGLGTKLAQFNPTRWSGKMTMITAEESLESLDEKESERPILLKVLEDGQDETETKYPNAAKTIEYLHAENAKQHEDLKPLQTAHTDAEQRVTSAKANVEKARKALTDATQTAKEGGALGLNLELLRAQDDKTSGAIMEALKDDTTFADLSKREMDGIIGRDDEDGKKLQVGIDFAVSKGVLPGDKAVPEYEKIDVLGKTADQVANEILAKLPKGEGCVVILCGLSGTGKGTTVSKLSSKVANASTWSNGNVFRSITLLAATHCENSGQAGFDPGCLTPENLQEWVSMLNFDKYDGKFDIKITGLGIDAKVSEICNTKLKEEKVSENIPTVAQKTQGEVVKFAGDACIKMGKEGTVVLVEGREQTLNFIDSPYRFCLTLSDPIIIGQRRAAQRIAGAAAEAAKKAKDGEDAEALVKAALAEIAKK